MLFFVFTMNCLLYTSDAADEEDSVDLGGRRIIKNSIEVLGDNIEYSDDSYKFGLINNEKVIGIVTSKIKKIF